MKLSFKEEINSGGYVCRSSRLFRTFHRKQIIQYCFFDNFFFKDACRHHPGVPYFHDAYKGWSCCKKKSVDFTEFLNIKGCELSKHSNEKPIEPEKPEQKIVEEEPPKEIREPVKSSTLVRPPYDSPMTTIVPVVAPALKQAIDSLVISSVKRDASPDSAIAVGTTCKYGGCGATYESPASDDTECNYHPGVPVFHEGLKYWSCCTKRTTDFAAFMSQKGCAYGKHKWISIVSLSLLSTMYALKTLPMSSNCSKRIPRTLSVAMIGIKRPIMWSLRFMQNSTITRRVR